jgi:hypothetical protein
MTRRRPKSLNQPTTWLLQTRYSLESRFFRTLEILALIHQPVSIKSLRPLLRFNLKLMSILDSEMKKSLSLIMTLFFRKFSKKRKREERGEIKRESKPKRTNRKVPRRSLSEVQEIGSIKILRINN